MSEGTLSPDGKFLWTGEEWIPAPPEQTQSSPDAHFNAPESPRPKSYNPYLPREDSDSSGEDSAEYDLDGTVFALVSWVLGYNGAVLLAIIFTAYSLMSADVEPGWISSYDYLVLKALAVAWVIGIILTVYCRVNLVFVEDEVALKVLRDQNKISAVLLALPLLPIALFLLLLYFTMKYGKTHPRYR
uniref:Uncharacterized protein n=1 Tax=uncultured marine group II/III euryarchaeote SAT1000_32_C10 TaxID=1456573 RepID=A0A075I9C4_9EURY|nr:hypothetical protein [uncultured marine group II/III euryarchaeote SAT1000_32_C10]